MYLFKTRTMKRPIILTILFISFFACKKENSTFSKIENTVNNAKNASKVISNVKDAQKEAQNLVNIQPVTKATLKAWMPSELIDLKRTSYSLNNNGLVNFSTINLQYKSAENIKKQFKIEIIDGAGTGATAIYMYKMIENMSMDKESENSYEKIYKREKTTIRERYTTGSYGSRLKMEFLINNRFAVNVNANNITANQMWKYVQAMQFGNLQSQ